MQMSDAGARSVRINSTYRRVLHVAARLEVGEFFYVPRDDVKSIGSIRVALYRDTTKVFYCVREGDRYRIGRRADPVTEREVPAVYVSAD